MTYLDPSNALRVEAGMLDVSYHDLGPRDGTVAILLHGFPYDVQAYGEVSDALTSVGWRTVIPYLRGYGPTRFLDDDTPRSGQQAVLAYDLITLMDALEIERAVLAGYDWGGRAACIVSALWPERAHGLVTGNGYNLQNIARSGEPAPPRFEHGYWYQYYFHSERGREGLRRNRSELCRLLWELWSPNWVFSDDTFARSASSFDNPDFVDVVVHSYRHRYALVPGDPAVAPIEERLAGQPDITVPTVSLDGDGDGVHPSRSKAQHAKKFSGPFDHQIIPRIGHNIPQEAPEAFAAAIQSLI